MKNEIFYKNKIIDHFNFIKKTSNYSDVLLKNIQINKQSSLLPITFFHKNNKWINKLLDINKWINKMNFISFYLSDDKINPPQTIIGVEIANDLNIVLHILHGNNTKDILETSVSLIKYFNNVFFFNKIKFDKTYSNNFTKKIEKKLYRRTRKKILTAGPSISLIETFNTYHAAKNGWNDNSAKYLNDFENYFSNYLKVKHSLTTSSCTGALQIALMALEIGYGDEVIVPDLTWVSTATAVRDVGAKPVFADVEFDSWNVDSRSIKKLITSRTKALIVVHLYGQPARMNQIVNIAKKYNLRLIEDAAPAIGAKWQNKYCGTFGDFSAFSFQGSKLLVTGEGGMLVTNKSKLYKKALKIWDLGKNSNNRFWIDGKGVKFKMSNIQAAFGLSQISRVDEQIAMKRRIFEWYYENLKDNPNFILHKEINNSKSIYWMTSLYIKNDHKISRDKLISMLSKKNIDSRPVFPTISQYPIWNRKIRPQKISSLISKKGINLPSGVNLSKKDVDFICKTINNIFL